MATETKTKKTTKSSAGSSISVYELNGEVKTTVALPEAIFNVKVSQATITQYIKAYLVNQRQGNVSTKTRSEVTGSTKKIYRQKGTGGARHGSRKANIFVKGGVAFGPKPRFFVEKINKKQKRLALLSSLTIKAQEKGILGLTDKAMDVEVKTKPVADFIRLVQGAEKKVLIITNDTTNPNFFASAKNISNVTVANVKSINPFIVLKSDMLIFAESAIPALQDHFKTN